MSLIDVQQRQYTGHAFYIKDDKVIKFPADGRIMIDPAFFREMLPSYPRFQKP